MKYNLKNRPKPKFDLGSPYCGGWLRTYTEWFKGFQKELQERIQHWESLIQPNDCYHKLYCVNFAKEILGE